ncbi:MAG TPA: FtsQ-type POTRA domain-containing protein [Anaerovoracaceae bacterium]|nr:FtsQ-type POTRA domain-containing protein [Anaerovoracaceae bacterium]
MTEEAKNNLRKKKKRRKKHYLLRIVLSLVIISAIAVFLTSSFFNLGKVTVEGNSYFADNEIIIMADVEGGSNLFFGVDSGRTISRLTASPYIDNASVTRRLPNEIIIEIDERKQIAAATYGDKYILIDSEGMVLRISETKPKVTILKGLTLTKVNEGESLEAEEKIVLKNTLKMLNAMESGDLYFIKIEMSELFINAYIFNSLVCKGAPDNMLHSIESGDIQKTLATMFNDGITRGTLYITEGDGISYNPEVE